VGFGVLLMRGSARCALTERSRQKLARVFEVARDRHHTGEMRIDKSIRIWMREGRRAKKAFGVYRGDRAPAR